MVSFEMLSGNFFIVCFCWEWSNENASECLWDYESVTFDTFVTALG